MDALMNVNAKGVLLCSQAAARHMIAQGSGGRIINNASGAGKIAPGKDAPLGALCRQQACRRRADQADGVGVIVARDSRQLRVRRHCGHADVGFD